MSVTIGPLLRFMFAEYVINSKFDNSFEGKVEFIVPKVMDSNQRWGSLIFLSVLVALVLIFSLIHYS